MRVAARFVAPLFMLAAGGAAFSAAAQHAGHAMPMPAPMQADPHAGHGSSGAAMPADPHAGHAMPMPAPMQADPHAGHGSSGSAMPADPHAGHAIPMTTPTPTDPHAGHRMGSGDPPMPTEAPAAPSVEAPPPPEALTGPAHAADTIFDPQAMSAAREQLRTNQGGMRTWKVMADRLETRIHDGRDGYLWDLQAWYGGDIDKLWIKSEGAAAWGETLEEAEVQVLWSRAVTPWYNAQGGIRYDFEPDAGLTHLVLGLEGLAPFYVEVDAAAFVSERGDLTARIELEYDQPITQKLVLQPRLEIEAAAQDVKRTGTGAGLSSFDAGLRLRYEFVPNFAPYIGVAYERKLGDTGRMAREEGEDAGTTSLVAGIRFWF